MPYRISEYLNNTENQLYKIIGDTIVEVIERRGIQGKFSILHNREERQKWGVTWADGGFVLDINFCREVEQRLREQLVYNSYDGIIFSREHNGIFIDLSGFTDSPVHDEPPYKEDEQVVEMDNYIDTERYNQYEKFHPGYTSMMRRVTAQTLKAFRKADRYWPGNWKVLEYGSGPGELTKRLGDTNKMLVTAVEYDSKGVGFLNYKIGKGDIKNTEVVQGDFIAFARQQPEKSWTVVVSTFADHHFNSRQKFPLHRNIDMILKPGGKYIIGEEFLGPHNERDPAERVTAHVEYNGTMIIGDAFEAGCVEMPTCEFEALVSGLRTTVRYIQQEFPDLANENFRVRSLPEVNKYNVEGIKVLDKLINRLASLDLANLPNPEELDENTIVEKRLAFIQKLHDLKEELTTSRCAGLQEDKSKKIVGGDFKMTVRQWLRHLHNAGMHAVGYFEGPKPVGNYDKEFLNRKGGIRLEAGENYPPGVWTIVATSLELNSNWGRHVRNETAPGR